MGKHLKHTTITLSIVYADLSGICLNCNWSLQRTYAGF